MKPSKAGAGILTALVALLDFCFQPAADVVRTNQSYPFYQEGRAVCFAGEKSIHD